MCVIEFDYSRLFGNSGGARVLPGLAWPHRSLYSRPATDWDSMNNVRLLFTPNKHLALFVIVLTEKSFSWSSNHNCKPIKSAWTYAISFFMLICYPNSILNVRIITYVFINVDKLFTSWTKFSFTLIPKTCICFRFL